ncbi:MAG: ECF transporter S component [Actinomycetota bacterium]
MVGFFWPFFIDSHSGHRHQINQIFLYVAVPIALALLISEISNERLDAKSVALLGVLAALTAAVRPLGAGAVGIEPMWFILILSARVFGPAFGFVLGILAIFVSACLTGGFGPWLPYQMFAAGWIGLAAGALPNRIGKRAIRGSSEIVLLIFFSIIASLAFGFLLDLQFWPWSIGSESQLSYVGGASVLDNLHRFVLFHFATSMAWDIPRAIFTSGLVIVTAPAVLFALRRSKRKASFLTPIEFHQASALRVEHAMEQREV